MDALDKKILHGERVLSQFQKLVGIASSLSIIVGVAMSMIQMNNFVENNRRADLTLRLTTLQQVSTFLAEDEGIRRKAMSFMANNLPAIMAKKDAAIKEMGSGEAFYLSSEMADFAKINYHYERLGALTKLGYVEFPLIFEIIPFPDTYMRSVEPLNNSLRKNWRGVGKELPALWANISYLKNCFETSRRNPSKKPTCEDG